MPPPFGADAFRPLRAGDVVGHAAPAETPRRTVGDERGDILDRLGVGQQQKRTRFLLPRLRPRGCLAVERRQHFGAFGQVTGHRFEAPHAVWSKTFAQRSRSNLRNAPSYHPRR